MTNQLKTKKEIAELLQCTPRHIDNLVKSRSIPATKIGRLIRFDWLRVQKALERFTTKEVGYE